MSLAVQHFKWNVAQVADLEPPAVARMYPHRSDDYLPEAFLCSGKKSVEQSQGSSGKERFANGSHTFVFSEDQRDRS